MKGDIASKEEVKKIVAVSDMCRAYRTARERICDIVC